MLVLLGVAPAGSSRQGTSIGIVWYFRPMNAEAEATLRKMEPGGTWRDGALVMAPLEAQKLARRFPLYGLEITDEAQMKQAAQ